MKIKSSQGRKAASPSSADTPAQKISPGEEGINLVPGVLELKEILVPIDFSESSRKSLRYALAFAKQFGARITLLYVLEPIVYPSDLGYVPTMVENDQTSNAARQKLESLAKNTVGADLLSQTLVRTGSPFREIADAARDLNADLVILSTHGYTGLKHVLLGSTAERVVRHAPCPVLIVREREHEFV